MKAYEGPVYYMGEYNSSLSRNEANYNLIDSKIFKDFSNYDPNTPGAISLQDISHKGNLVYINTKIILSKNFGNFTSGSVKIPVGEQI
jgi:hypothetical protein